MTVSLAHASTVVDAAIAAARNAGLNPLTVVVLDAGGHMVAVKREDRSGILRVAESQLARRGALRRPACASSITCRTTT